jgi:hypothetical protein
MTYRTRVPSPSVPSLRKWLRDRAAAIEAIQPPNPSERYRSMERFVLELGRPERSGKLTAKEDAIVETAMTTFRVVNRTIAHRQCFHNSQHLVMCDASRQMVYVEGYAWSPIADPVLHGWVVVNGKVIDVTSPALTTDDLALPDPRQVRGVFSGRAYFGVPFRRTYIAERLEATGSFGTLIDDWEHQYPLLQTGGDGAIWSETLGNEKRAKAR